jgi:hypothetical protein
MRRAHRNAHLMLWPLLAVLFGIALALSLVMRAPAPQPQPPQSPVAEGQR